MSVAETIFVALSLLWVVGWISACWSVDLPPGWRKPFAIAALFLLWPRVATMQVRPKH